MGERTAAVSKTSRGRLLSSLAKSRRVLRRTRVGACCGWSSTQPRSCPWGYHSAHQTFRLHSFFTRGSWRCSGKSSALNVAAQVVPRGPGQMRQEDEVWMKATWSVVILFEDAQTREKAVKFCDQLVERFWAHCEFRLTWMEFSALDDANAARDAHAKARGAD